MAYCLLNVLSCCFTAWNPLKRSFFTYFFKYTQIGVLSHPFPSACVCILDSILSSVSLSHVMLTLSQDGAPHVVSPGQEGSATRGAEFAAQEGRCISSSPGPGDVPVPPRAHSHGWEAAVTLPGGRGMTMTPPCALSTSPPHFTEPLLECYAEL